MEAVVLDHPDGKHKLILHEKTPLAIRRESDPTWPGWVEIGNLFSDHVILLDTYEEIDALVKMLSIAHSIYKEIDIERKRLNEDEQETVIN
jgi:hypothetical protein